MGISGGNVTIKAPLDQTSGVKLAPERTRLLVVFNLRTSCDLS